jgi:hypothetical protein
MFSRSTQTAGTVAALPRNRARSASRPRASSEATAGGSSPISLPICA